METLNTVNQWIDIARGLLGKQAQLPLIDDSEIDMDEELRRVRRGRGDDSLRAAIDNVLSRDPDDLTARFVTLNCYYRLISTKWRVDILEIEGIYYESTESASLDHEDILKHLGYLVRLRDPASCTDIASVRWEIVNASAVQDYQRMLALCDQLNDKVPAGERHYFRGRVHFLIAILPTWDTEESLECWDLPLGPTPAGPRRVGRWLNAAMLIRACIQKFPTRASLTEDGLDHLRDATKYLEKAIASECALPVSARLMLARSYASIGDGGNAARHYQWMLDHQNTFFRSCMKEAGPEWDEEEDSFLRSGVHECLVNAYDDAGDLDKAIVAANAWIDACPDQLGTFERMARLHQKRPDPVAAAECLRKEKERDNAFGEDPNVSIILALGGIVSQSRIDETLKNLAATHPQEHALLDSVIKNYWPTFGALNVDARQKWVTGDWLLGSNVPHSAGTAAHCFAWVVEGELRTSIFAPFAGHARNHPEILSLCTDDEKSKPFCRYLKGNDNGFALGQMFKVLDFARRPPLPIISSFAEWIKRDYPDLLAGVGQLRPDKLVAFRNREDHASMRIIEPHEAAEMSGICRKVIDLLHPKPGTPPGMQS